MVIDMNKDSKMLISIFFGLIVVSAFLAFYKFVVLEDYFIKVETDCDIETESCFISRCDPAEDETCPADPEEQVSYYKFVKKKAGKIAFCNGGEGDCPPPICEPDEECKVIICNPDTVEDGVECHHPKIK